MSHKTRYPSISEQINKAQYQVYLSEYYANVPAYVLEGIGAPIYDYDPHRQCELVKGVATISQMIDMCHNGYQFIILRPEDILDVHRLLGQYLELLSISKIEPSEKNLMMDKIRRLLKEMQIPYNRAIKELKLDASDPHSLDSLLNDLISNIYQR